MVAVPADLTARERQILDYVRTFLADEGYLPTTREVARGCGLRSPTSVRRALAKLEGGGLIVRDPANPRLGAIQPGEGADVSDVAEPVQELVLCESIMVEMEAGAEAARRGLPFAPDLETQELVHREALARIRLHRTYQEIRDRLARRAGATDAGAVAAAAERHRELARQRVERIDSWDSYCLNTLVFRVAVRAFLAEPSSEVLSHLRPVYAAELEVLDKEDRPDLQAVVERIRAGDAALNRKLTEHVATLRETFVELSAIAPAMAAGDLPEAVARALDLALEPPPT